MMTRSRGTVTGSLLSLAARYVAALTNSGNYFSYPAVYAPVPSVIAGDTLNVSWSSNYTNGDLYVHCNGEQESETIGLDGIASQPITIKESWASPCHFQLGIANGDGWFDSGFVNIVDEDRATTTWGVTNQCLQTTSASSAATGVATSSSSSNAMTSGTAAEGTAMCSPGEGSGPGMGAGIGIGIGISAGAAAIPMLLMLLRRKKKQQKEKLQPPVQGGGEHYNIPSAAAGTTELHSHEYSEMSADNSNLAELEGQHGRK